MLNSILETAYDKPVLSRRADGFYVVPTTNANIVHPNLLMSIIQRYSDWYVPKSNDSSILATLLETFQSLVREKHPRQLQNIQSLNKAGLIPALLNFCKIHLVGAPEPVFLSRQAAESIVNLISIFAGSPPSSGLLDDIIKVLLLLHRPELSFITHDRSNFYFLMSSLVMVKQKRISLPMSTRKLSINIRRERKNTVPIRNFKTSKTQAGRSVSLDHSLNNPIALDQSLNNPIDGNVTVNLNEQESVTRENEPPVQSTSQVKPPEYPPCPTSDGLEAIVSYSAADRRMKKLLNPTQSPTSLLNLQLKKRTFNKRKMSRKNHSNFSSRTTTDSENEKDIKAKGLTFVFSVKVRSKIHLLFSIIFGERY